MDFSKTNFLKNNKQLLGPAILFVLAGFILLRVVVPMISTISAEKAKLVESEERVKKLTETQNTIQQINADNIAENIRLTQSALPMNKDIIQIYTQITDIAAKNSMQVGSFSVKVGEVYTKEDVQTTPPVVKAEQKEFPTLDIAVSVDAPDSESFFQFSKDLMRTLPLASVNNFSTDELEGRYEISFYYKPINPSVLAEQEFVTPLTESDQKSLQTIQEFDQN